MTIATDMLDPEIAARRERRIARINRAGKVLAPFGLGFVVPLSRLVAGDTPSEQWADLKQMLLVPLIGILAFLAAWAFLAPKVQTSLGAIPGPAAVFQQAEALVDDHVAERQKAEAFYQRQDERNQMLIAEGYADRVKVRPYTGKPTYFDQIWTSLMTVALGFFIGTIIAVPVGIACGLSKTFEGAINPLIQLFKPVSPLAWLPIVTMVVAALYESQNDLLPKSMVISAITVTLCSIWPTIINTALGVASIDRDLVNVGKVLQLSTWTTIRKLVLPSSLPLIFTGMRLSLGVGWMVLIAAEMLAQNPGLGKFVWDEFQNGSSDSLARIIVAVITIGLIGFFLDRVMFALQTAFTYSANR